MSFYLCVVLCNYLSVSSTFWKFLDFPGFLWTSEQPAEEYLFIFFSKYQRHAHGLIQLLLLLPHPFSSPPERLEAKCKSWNAISASAFPLLLKYLSKRLAEHAEHITEHRGAWRIRSLLFTQPWSYRSHRPEHQVLLSVRFFFFFFCSLWTTKSN